MIDCFATLQDIFPVLSVVNDHLAIVCVAESCRNEDWCRGQRGACVAESGGDMDRTLRWDKGVLVLLNLVGVWTGL